MATQGVAGSIAGWTSIFAIHLALQALIFLIASMIAWRGLARREAHRATTAPKPIDDEAQLIQRRRRFPYYLIDPLRRAEDIHDNQNPAYVKELRAGSLAKTTRLIRLMYVGVAVSFLFAFPILAGRIDGQHWARLTALFSLSMVALFIPILAATAISKEREEGTLDLLRTTLLSPWAILRAKLRAALRFEAALWLSAVIVPAIVYLVISVLTTTQLRGMGRNGEALLQDAFWGALRTTPAVAGFLLFYTSICLAWSARCRRNVTAIVASYVTIAALIFLPTVFSTIAEKSGGQQQGRRGSRRIFSLPDTTADERFRGLPSRAFVSPLTSHVFYFAPGLWNTQYPNENPDSHLFQNWPRGSEGGEWIHLGLLTGLSALLLWRASRRLNRRKD